MSCSLKKPQREEEEARQVRRDAWAADAAAVAAERNKQVKREATALARQQAKQLQDSTPKTPEKTKGNKAKATCKKTSAATASSANVTAPHSAKITRSTRASSENFAKKHTASTLNAPPSTLETPPAPWAHSSMVFPRRTLNPSYASSRNDCAPALASKSRSSYADRQRAAEKTRATAGNSLHGIVAVRTSATTVRRGAAGATPVAVTPLATRRLRDETVPRGSSLLAAKQAFSKVMRDI